MKCKDCRRWHPRSTMRCGECSSPKMLYGYDVVFPGPDEVLIENDEGWGMLTGPEFGCVHFEAKA